MILIFHLRTLHETMAKKQYIMAGATVPYELSEAVDVCKKKKSGTTASTRDSPIDIVGVVVDLSYTREPFPIAYLWIQDPSLPPGVKALFSLRGLKALAFIQECKVSIGDIVRFNRVSLKEIEKETTGGEDAVYHFHHSWTDPEAGPEWCRLGRIGGNINGDFTQDVLVIPDQMRTDDACLERLIEWYRESDYFSARGNQNPCLSQLPCHQRSLAQLQSLIGVVSNIVVKVTDFQNAPPNYELGRKRRHSSISTAPCSFALLTDGVCSMPLFLDDKSRFRTLLQQAVTTGRLLRLTHVSSQAGRSRAHVGRIQKDALDEVVLVPTKSTMATLLKDGDAVPWGPEESQVDPTQSQLPTNLTHIPSQPTSSRHHTILLSPIEDIVLLSGGSSIHTSLAQVSEYPDASTRWALALVESLGDTNTPSYQYSSACVTLEAAVLSGDQEVEACGSIVQKLCGDLSVEELVSGEESFHQHAYNIMVSLWKDRVPLRWTLEQEPEGTMSRVVNVSLHKLVIGNTNS